MIPTTLPIALPRPGCARRKHAAFTLIELLTVIAIIAILAAIIFPVFSAVQENARRGSTMSNMHKIAQAVAAYELDNREYPEFLFGPAIIKTTGLPGSSTNSADYFTMRETANIVTRSGNPVGATIANNVRRIYSKSLYPEYIRDLDTFSCANNTIARTPDIPSIAIVARYNSYNMATMARLPPASIIPVETPFYKYDAYDTSPRMLRNAGGSLNGQLDTTRSIARYSRVWYPIVADPSTLSQSDLTAYRRQLIFRRPPSETYITLTTFHVPKDKVLVLWLNGTAKVLPVAKFNDARFTDSGAGDVKGYVLGSGE